MKRGMDAYPQFYRQIGKEPRELVGTALALLAKRLICVDPQSFAGAADLNVTQLFVAG
jgi:hypothetical protein